MEFKIIGSDHFGNPSEPLEFCFINDQNTFEDLYIEGYSFDQVYSIFEAIYFKIYPTAQDIEVLNLICGSTAYQFEKHMENPGDGLYFTAEILRTI